MDTDDFDTTLLAAAMAQAEQGGWSSVSLLDAARTAGLPLPETRERFPFRASVLLRLGRIADDSALADDTATGSSRERLFDLLMRRLDVFQQYRNGIKAVLRTLPFDPLLRFCWVAPRWKACAGWPMLRESAPQGWAALCA